MMPGLTASLSYDELTPGIAGRFLQHGFKTGSIDIVGTGKGQQDPTGTQDLERPQIDLFVAGEGFGDGVAIAGERRWVEHNDVELLPALLKLT